MRASGSEVAPDPGSSPPVDGPRPLCLRGGLLVTMDPEARVLERTDLLVRAGRIAAIGSGLEIPPETRQLDVSGCAVLPGLIQGHVHLGQTLFRGLAEERRLLAWLRERIWPLEAAHDAESAYWSARLGGLECLLGGTTTIQEIGLGPEAEALLEGIVDSGLRAIAGKCLMDVGDGLPERLAEPTAATLEETERLGERFDGAAGGRVRYVLNPRFALSCTETLLREVAAIALRRGWPVHTHALEQRDETAAVRAATGRGEIDLFRDLGLLDADLRIAHGVWLRPRHWPELARRKFSVVHCPGSNLKLGSGIARIAGLRRAGIPVGVGADGPPCNNRLDAWAELRLASHLQALREGPGALGGLDALRLATSEGARAIGLDHEIGTLEIGKAADLAVLELGRSELLEIPGVDVHDRIAFGAGPEAVRHVAVGGVLRVENGRTTDTEPTRILESSARAARRVAERAGLAR